jgi:hypothetical protein
VITKILHKPVSIAQHVVSGVARGGLHGAVTVVRKMLPDDDTPAEHVSPSVSTDPVRQPRSPTTTTKHATTNTAPAEKARTERNAKKTGKKTTAEKSAAKKPAAALDEDPAPADDDPVVYSSGPDPTVNVPKDDLDDLRP